MKKLTIPALIVCIPLVGCGDSSPPSWPEDAALQLRIDEGAIVAEWPEAADDKGISSYIVSVDGNPGPETGPDARNWKAMDVSLGNPHEFSVIAKDGAGNETAPLTAKWEAKDLEGPEWPLGSLLQVKQADPAEKPAVNGTLNLRLTWPEATDPSGVEFYRIVEVPTELGDDVVRPRLIGMVKPGDYDLETKGKPSTRFQVYAIDKEENSSKPLAGALENPTRLDPTKSIRQLQPKEAATPAKVDKEKANAIPKQ